MSINRPYMRVAAITVTILAIPLVAMLFTSEVDWDVRDFAAMGILLLGCGIVFEQILQRVTTPAKRLYLGIALFAALFLIWAELAVGIFNSPFAGS